MKPKKIMCLCAVAAMSLSFNTASIIAAENAEIELNDVMDNTRVYSSILTTTVTGNYKTVATFHTDKGVFVKNLSNPQIDVIVKCNGREYINAPLLGYNDGVGIGQIYGGGDIEVLVKTSVGSTNDVKMLIADNDADW